MSNPADIRADAAEPDGQAEPIPDPATAQPAREERAPEQIPKPGPPPRVAPGPPARATAVTVQPDAATEDPAEQVTAPEPAAAPEPTNPEPTAIELEIPDPSTPEPAATTVAAVTARPAPTTNTVPTPGEHVDGPADDSTPASSTPAAPVSDEPATAQPATAEPSTTEPATAEPLPEAAATSGPALADQGPEPASAEAADDESSQRASTPSLAEPDHDDATAAAETSLSDQALPADEPAETPEPAERVQAAERPRPAIPSPADLAKRQRAAVETEPAPAAVTPAPTTADSQLAKESRPFGRVDDEGHVFVNDGGTEREIGVWQAGEGEAGVEFYVQRHLFLHAELDLVEQRLRGGKLAPGEAHATLKRHDKQLEQAPGIGDLPALRARAAELRQLADEIRSERAAAKTAATEQARAAKEALVVEAEKLGGSNDWRGGVARFRTLLDQWKELPRLDRTSDDALWHRFSTARTTYTRRRKAHFGELNTRRDVAKSSKEALLVEAESLAGSTDWAETGKRMRTLMDQWKAAGGAAREVDEQLWQRFRAAQDSFFAARTAYFAKQDEEFAENAKVKESLLQEAERLLPVRNIGEAKRQLRALQDRWNAVGKVPRDSMRPLEQRMRAVEAAVGEAESDQWRRSNPEMRARAESTVAMLRESVADLERQLEAAQASGEARKASAAEESLTARRSWLVEAERVLSDFSD